MNTDLKRFIVKITGISIILALVGWLIFALFLPEYYLSVLPFALLFFLTATIFVHAYQLNLAKKDIAKFTRFSMLVTFLKLVVYSVFGVVYIAFNSENAVVFVICLMILYAVYTIIEVVEITQISRRK